MFWQMDYGSLANFDPSYIIDLATLTGAVVVSRT